MQRKNPIRAVTTYPKCFAPCIMTPCLPARIPSAASKPAAACLRNVNLLRWLLTANPKTQAATPARAPKQRASRCSARTRAPARVNPMTRTPTRTRAPARRSPQQAMHFVGAESRPIRQNTETRRSRIHTHTHTHTHAHTHTPTHTHTRTHTHRLHTGIPVPWIRSTWSFSVGVTSRYSSGCS